MVTQSAWHLDGQINCDHRRVTLSIVKVITDFKPETHGFGFPNRFSGGQVVGELARQGRLDELAGLDLPAVLPDMISLIRGMSFWGTFGLCGGMSWAALDAFFAGQSAPTLSGPGPDSDLFGLLVRRQADSMRGTAMLERCLRWQITPDQAPWWWPWSTSVRGATEREEWPQLKVALDAGRPESLCLIRVRGVASPDRHHQVVATGYELEGSNLRVRLYDPNHPKATPVLTMQLRRRPYKMEPRQTTGEDLRGFFVWPHLPPP